MIFNEALYPIFLALSAGVFHLIPKHWRAWWLFATGLVFYAYYSDLFVWLFVAEAVVIYLVMGRYKRNLGAFLACLLGSIAVLGYFKYKNMILIGAFTLWDRFQGGGIPAFEALIFPLAISFFTFEFIHYLVDYRQGKLPPHGFKEFLAFIMFFPTMVAGPIKRFQDFVPKIERATFSWDDLHQGIWRILIGMAKKIVVADSMDLWIQPLLSGQMLAGATPGELWLALLAYSVKIYLDFSGYSDIAIGSARLFGIRVPENFNWPYLQANITQFWRHWHISLTSWITDYVFIPLGGSRGGRSRAIANTLIAMGASGIWHGAAWHFMVWGLYHGALLSLYRLFKDLVKPRMPWWERHAAVTRPVSILVTFVLVTLGWGLFIMPVERFGQMLPRLVGL